MNRKPTLPLRKLALFEREGGVCHICSVKIQVGQPWDVEHVIPFALGGADDESNMQPAHKICHAPKTVDDVRRIAKAKRMAAKHVGIKKQSKWQTKFKRKVNGKTVLRDGAAVGKV